MSTLIIAEDEPDVRELYRQYASVIFHGFAVVSLEKAEELLAVARELSDPIILADNNTKSLKTGIEAMKELREYEARFKRNPSYAALITGDSTRDFHKVRADAIIAGFDEAHRKPIDPDAVFSQILQNYMARASYLQTHHL